MACFWLPNPSNFLKVVFTNYIYTIQWEILVGQNFHHFHGLNPICKNLPHKFKACVTCAKVCYVVYKNLLFNIPGFCPAFPERWSLLYKMPTQDSCHLHEWGVVQTDSAFTVRLPSISRATNRLIQLTRVHHPFVLCFRS